MKRFESLYPPLYPLDPWQIVEEELKLDNRAYSETVFALANGYIGIRGSFEEGLALNQGCSVEGIYINGFFDTTPIFYLEKAYGYADYTQTMLKVTDSKIIELFLEGERVAMDSGTLLAYRRSLDMAQGCLVREVCWRSPAGREIEYSFRRIVSFTHRHLLSFELKVKPLNFSGPVFIVSALDGNVKNNKHRENDPRSFAFPEALGLRVTGAEVSGTGAVILQETAGSGLSLACAMENTLRDKKSFTLEERLVDGRADLVFKFSAEAGKTCTFEKHAAYFTTRDYPAGELKKKSLELVKTGQKTGFKTLLEEQARHCRRYWAATGFELKGDLPAEQGLRFNLFHLMQAAGSSGLTGIAAKGLTGEGYEGHYFWDTEIYMLPFYTAIIPEQARELLKFRYRILDQARDRARTLSHERGALYPWRTIAGAECSSYYPAGTAQYHINAAIAHAICKYLQFTGDNEFLLDYGAEIIFETARVWESLGAYVPGKGDRFCFNGVTGPDEYTALVNNNCYTNLMARWHLQYACETAALIRKEHPGRYALLKEKIGLEEEELESWFTAAQNVYIPYDREKRIHPQDDSFLDKESWDFTATPADKYPLLLYYHPLVIYRYQVCKQPDLVLAQLLLEDIFDLEQKKRNYTYYEAITTHDSSLSPSMFSAAAAELGLGEDAYSYFLTAARLDLDNIYGDTENGVHLANMAGSWQALVYGFAGMKSGGKNLRFSPYLPRGWECYQFNLYYRGCRLNVKVKENGVEYGLLEGEAVSLFHFDEKVDLNRGEKVILPV